ncbi:NAD(P)/FAD-dependent oxidoreductase [Agromyces cerinus]|uniref:Thioredoxin reductase n=1 Tax=Agromyces cerinus subsp. cerinus TaxID=232089 RepID=A0A1N6G6Y4_9MICO|nr:NAD(P)/FAD-dependent oxidoreductase [Agromyces cerinus]SIO03221.1 Thioredoxin reductase [Agromyces cerinus subsp. cerinus]
MAADLFDVAVVGGGPAGLSAALSLARARRRVIVFDAGDPRNGVAEHMHGVLGHDGVPPTSLLERGRREVEQYGGLVVDGRIERARVGPSGVEVDGPSGVVRARRLIVATGLRDGLPAITGLQEHWGRGVVVCPYCDGWERRNHTIGVIAAGPQGIDQAHQLRQWSDEIVYFPNDVGEPGADAVRTLEARGIRIERGRVRAIRSSEGRVEAVELDDRSVAVETIFTATTLHPRDRLLRDLGARTRDDADGSWVVVDPDGRTSVEHVWAVGNVVDRRSNVSVSLGAGSLIAGAVNADLTADDIAGSLRRDTAGER